MKPFEYNTANLIAALSFYGTVEQRAGLTLVTSPVAHSAFNVAVIDASAPDQAALLVDLLKRVGDRHQATPAQVALAWNAATNATGYNVKRSLTNGGSYTVIATNLASLAYTNTGLANGMLYYFVVSATNSAGESLNSSQVSARPVSAMTTATRNCLWSGRPITRVGCCKGRPTPPARAWEQTGAPSAAQIPTTRSRFP